MITDLDFELNSTTVLFINVQLTHFVHDSTKKRQVIHIVDKLCFVIYFTIPIKLAEKLPKLVRPTSPFPIHQKSLLYIMLLHYFTILYITTHSPMSHHLEHVFFLRGAGRVGGYLIPSVMYCNRAFLPSLSLGVLGTGARGDIFLFYVTLLC